MIGQFDGPDLGVFIDRYKVSYFSFEIIFLAGDDRIAQAVAALIKIEGLFDRLVARVPGVLAVADINVTAGIVLGHGVIEIAGDSPQPGITVKAVAAGRIGKYAEVILKAQIIDPGQRRVRPCDDIFTGSVIKITILRSLHFRFCIPS